MVFIHTYYDMIDRLAEMLNRSSIWSSKRWLFFLTSKMYDSLEMGFLDFDLF